MEGKGIHSAWDVQDQMVEKHGAAQSPRWDPRLTQDLPSATVEDLEEWARKADPKSGAGLDGRRAHSVMSLAQYAFADHAEDEDEDESDPLHGPPSHGKALPATRLLWEAIIDQRFPPWVVDHFVRGRLIAVVKKHAEESSTGGVEARPVNIASIERRLVEKAVTKAALPELRRHLEPQQLAVGTPFGCEALRYGLMAHMAMHPDHVCITIDAKNAFYAFDRAKAMKVLYLSLIHI